MLRVAIIGNGLSIAANAGFALPALTQAIRNRLDAVALGNMTVRLRIEEIAAHMNAEGAPYIGGFEQLLGPVDRLATVIDAPLSAVIGAVRPGLAQPLHEVALEVRALYMRGVGAVLESVDALDLAANLDPVETVVNWITDGLGADDAAVLYTLNYDPLIDRVLLDSEQPVVGGNAQQAVFSLADEFSGQAADISQVLLVPGAAPLMFYGMRGAPWPRARRVDLVHLHGAQHWVRLDSGLLVKSPMNGLRAADVYGRWTRDDPVHGKPAVLLTDQKGVAVSRSPFADGYRRLREDLRQADRTAILGYGFGDRPLNAVIGDVLHGPLPIGSAWIINRNAVANDDEFADVYVETADALGLDPQDLPGMVCDGLPNVALTRADFFTA